MSREVVIDRHVHLSMAWQAGEGYLGRVVAADGPRQHLIVTNRRCPGTDCDAEVHELVCEEVLVPSARPTEQLQKSVNVDTQGELRDGNRRHAALTSTDGREDRITYLPTSVKLPYDSSSS